MTLITFGSPLVFLKSLLSHFPDFTLNDRRHLYPQPLAARSIPVPQFALSILKNPFPTTLTIMPMSDIGLFLQVSAARFGQCFW